MTELWWNKVFYENKDKNKNRNKKNKNNSRFWHSAGFVVSLTPISGPVSFAIVRGP